MRKPIMRIYILMLALCAPLLAQAQPAAEPAPPEETVTVSPDTAATTVPISTGTAPEYELVELLGGKDQLLDIQSQLVDSLPSANPALDGYQLIVADWASQHLDWEEIREGMAKVYRDYFTAVELEKMLEFYRSPTGRKSVLLMPTLFREGSQIGMELAQAHKPELIEMLREAQQAPQSLPQPMPQAAAQPEIYPGAGAGE